MADTPNRRRMSPGWVLAGLRSRLGVFLDISLSLALLTVLPWALGAAAIWTAKAAAAGLGGQAFAYVALWLLGCGLSPGVLLAGYAAYRLVRAFRV